jgi:hypothetical protein
MTDAFGVMLLVVSLVLLGRAFWKTWRQQHRVQVVLADDPLAQKQIGSSAQIQPRKRV